jgi:DNA-directed RNA polymerase subunit alpha
MESLPLELRRLAEELSKIQHQVNTANGNLRIAKSKFEMAQESLSTAKNELSSAQTQATEVNERKVALLKQVADLATAESNALPQGANIPRLEILSRSIDDLEFTVRATRCLKAANIYHIGDLVKYSEVELLEIPNLSRKSTNEIREVLLSRGLTLGMKVTGWSPPQS